MNIDDPDFGGLAYDDDLGAWTGRLDTSCFARCAIKWHLTPAGNVREWASDESEGDGSGGGVEINVADGGDGTGPGAEQRAALAAFRAGKARVCAAVLGGIARAARERYVTADQLPAGAPALTSQRDLVTRLCTADGVREWLDPPRIDFHLAGGDGIGYTSFNFNAGFDDEHGVAVLMLNDQVCEVGGSSDFYDR